MSQTIFLVGFMGAGKSYVGQRLAQLLRCDFLDLDALFVTTEGMSINTFFETHGEKAFRGKESALLKNINVSKKQVVSTGGGTPCFLDNMQWMNQNGVTIYLNASIDLLLDRLNADKLQRPLLRQLQAEEFSQFIITKYQERQSFYSLAHHNISFDLASEHTILEKIMQFIKL
jgi:shikimate kinase